MSCRIQTEIFLFKITDDCYVEFFFNIIGLRIDNGIIYSVSQGMNSFL